MIKHDATLTHFEMRQMQVIYFLSPRAQEKYASESFLEFFNQNLSNNSKRLIPMLEMQNERFLGRQSSREICITGPPLRCCVWRPKILNFVSPTFSQEKDFLFMLYPNTTASGGSPWTCDYWMSKSS